MADMDRKEEEKGVLEGKEVSRRDFLKMAGVAGAAVGLAGGLGGLVAACGGEEETTTTTTAGGARTTTAGGATTTTTAGSTTTVSAGAEKGREIKVGFVSPHTGNIAFFCVPDKYCMERAQEAIGEGIVCGDCKMHPVSIKLADSQSDTARAAAVAGDLINNDKVDLMVTASTPDTVNPVSGQCEALNTPCLSNDAPWQPFVDRANTGDFSVTYKWSYHTFWGLEDVIANFTDMWNQLPTNKKVGAMWSNDVDGQAWKGGWSAAWGPAGLTATVPSDFTIGAESFTTQINEFKKAGCEIGVGMFVPPDFTTFWSQAIQQGWKPKVASFGKALLMPESLAALGDIANGLTTEVWWMASHPFKSALLNGESCQQFADEYTNRTGNQWTQPLLHFIIFEMAVDVLRRTTNVDDKQAIMAAVKSMKVETIGGVIDFSAPVEPP